MACRTVRIALLVGAITAVAVSPARADDKTAPCGPTMRTIQVMECVPETYTVKRTSYKVECRTETFDSYRCECVPEVREQVCTVVKRVPVTTTQTVNVCKNVVTHEQRTVMKTCWKNVEECVMKKKLVSRGHWECEVREARLANCLAKFHRDPCNPCCEPCPKTRTHRKWVHCPVYECCPVKVCKKVCYQVPTTCTVAVCKQVMSTETRQVCSFKCVEEKVTNKCTVNVMRKVPCKATRTVRVCVPCEETVTCTRMVRRCVTRQVPCETTCCPTSDCCSSRGHRFSGFGGHGHRGNRCDAGCCR